MKSRAGGKKNKAPKGNEDNLSVVDEDASVVSWTRPILTGDESSYQLGNIYMREAQHKNRAKGKYNSIQVDQYMNSKNLNDYQKLNVVRAKA